GKAVPAARGRYFYGDYCTGTIWSLRISGGRAVDNRREATQVSGLSSFGQAANGELYAVSLGGGLYKLSPYFVRGGPRGLQTTIAKTPQPERRLPTCGPCWPNAAYAIACRDSFRFRSSCATRANPSAWSSRRLSTWISSTSLSRRSSTASSWRSSRDFRSGIRPILERPSRCGLVAGVRWSVPGKDAGSARISKYGHD